MEPTRCSGGVAHPPQQRLHHFQRQAFAGLAIRRRLELRARQMTQMCQRGVQVQNLQNKQLNRDDRIQNPLAPLVFGVRDRLQDR